MGKVKSFDRKQKPAAIFFVLAVIAIIVAIFALHSAKSKKEDSDKKSEKTTQSQTTTKKQEQPPELVAPTDYTMKRSIIISDTRAMEMYGISSKCLKAYAQTINNFSTKVPDSKVFVLLAPTSMEFYGPEKYNTNNRSQDKGIKIAYDALNKDIETVNIRKALRMHTDEYIYFRTDHHWTARGAYYAYTAFADKAGFEPSKLSSYEKGKIDGFVGSLYRYTQADVLKENPDYVETFRPKTETNGEIFQDSKLENPRPLTVVANDVKASNKYLAFIQGDNPITRIKTGNKNGKKIIVIKESYGNAFAPFLVDNYEEVYVTDPRRVDMNLAKFVKDNGIDNVLFLNYTFAPSNKTYMTAFKKMLS